MEKGKNEMSKQIRAAILGCGGVGQCIAQNLAKSELISELLLADVYLKGPEAVKSRTKSDKIQIMKVDASNPKDVAKLAKKADIIVNGATPTFNLKIMEGCLKGGANYIDMANGDRDFGQPMFEDQEKYAKQYEDAGLFALCGMGIDPGASDVFAKRAADRMESVEYVKVRDADSGKLEGYEFATYFSPESMLSECIKDPLYYEAKGDKMPNSMFGDGFGRTPALTVNEVYNFPQPMGPTKLYRTDHEETEFVPRFIGKKIKFCDFRISLDESFAENVRMLKKLNLVSFKPLKVKGVEVAPIDVVIASMPRPDDLGGKIKGVAMVLTEVGGKMRGQNTVIRTWTHISHEKAYEISGNQATSYQTAMPTAVTVEMFARGEHKFTGVKSPEAVDPVKFCDYLPAKDTPVFEEITHPATLSWK
jgi:saccharopine dehydrogenase (NAD+, L-lysine-forming)